MNFQQAFFDELNKHAGFMSKAYRAGLTGRASFESWRPALQRNSPTSRNVPGVTGNIFKKRLSRNTAARTMLPRVKDTIDGERHRTAIRNLFHNTML